MKRLLVVAATASVVLGVSGCGGSSGGTDNTAAPATSLPPSASSTGKPIFPSSQGPTSAERVTQGPVSIAIPSSFEQQGEETEQSRSTTVTYASTRKEGGQRAAIGVTWSTAKHTKSAQQEAEAFRGQLLDVEHVKDLRMVRVSWPGLRDAYQFAYTDHNVSPGLQTLVLMGSTSTGQFISVTAKTPPPLVGPLDVENICGSLRPNKASGG